MALRPARPSRCVTCGRAHYRFYAVFLQTAERSEPYRGLVCRNCFDELREQTNGLLHLTHEILAAYLPERPETAKHVDALRRKLRVAKQPGEPLISSDKLN